MSRHLFPVQVCMAPSQSVAVPIQGAIEQPGGKFRRFLDVMELFGNACLCAELGILPYLGSVPLRICSLLSVTRCFSRSRVVRARDCVAPAARAFYLAASIFATRALAHSTASSAVGRTSRPLACEAYSSSQPSPLTTVGGHACSRRYSKSLVHTSRVFS